MDAWEPRRRERIRLARMFTVARDRYVSGVALRIRYFEPCSWCGAKTYEGKPHGMYCRTRPQPPPPPPPRRLRPGDHHPVITLLPMTTQKDRADYFILKAQLSQWMPTKERVQELDTIVGEAQNSPPDGESDGSLDERRWTALRDLVEALNKATEALLRYQRAF